MVYSKERPFKTSVLKDILTDHMIKEDSLFLQEGKNMLIEEFGKEYAKRRFKGLNSIVYI